MRVKILLCATALTVSAAASSAGNLRSGMYKITTVSKEGLQKPDTMIDVTCVQGGEGTGAYFASLMPNFEGERCSADAPIFDVSQRQFRMHKTCSDEDAKSNITLLGTWTDTGFTAKLEITDHSRQAIYYTAEMKAVRKRSCYIKHLP